MKLKEIITKAGSISDYFLYIILLFGWYLAKNVLETVQPELFGGGIYQVLSFGLRLLVDPIILVIVFAGIHERQEIQDLFEGNSLFSQIKSHTLRFIGANFLSLILYFVVMFGVFLLAGLETQDPDDYSILFGVIAACFSMINLVWLSAVVVERKIWRGLARAIKALLFNPAALAIGVIWAGICFADSFLFDLKIEQAPLAIQIARAGVFAVLRVLATMYMLAVYKSIWGSAPIAPAGERVPGGTPITQPGEKLAKASLWFAFASFLPFFHLVALVLGVLTLKRSQRFFMRAAIACWVGGFFTILYVLLAAGIFANQSNTDPMPGYGFLADENAALEPYVMLLNQDAVGEAAAQLEDVAPGDSDRHWAFDSALALAKYQGDDLEGALPDFYTALQKNPERGEFYFYYGLALFDNGQNDMAIKQFRLALEHDPKLEIAGRYIALIQNIYQPTMISTSVMYLLILFLLFPLHEFGHAFAAWKLGDDTAKNQGRVTLNPVSHLDLFGSILLPAILILQQSDFIFGWARPVPVNRENFKNPDRDDRIVSFAGPAMNLLVSMACLIIVVLMVLVVRVLWPETISMNLATPFSSLSIAGPPFSKGIIIVIEFLKQLFYTSLILGFFNLIPVPPLDGSWILATFLPQGIRPVFERVRQFGFMIFVLLSMTHIFDYILAIPIGLAWGGLKMLASAIGFA